MSQPAKRSTSKKTLANSIVALSSAAVIAVYAAGYARTTPVAGQLATTDVAPSAPAAAAPSAPTATIAPTATVAATTPGNPARGGNFGAPGGGRQRPGGNDFGGGNGVGVGGAAPASPTPTPTPSAAGNSTAAATNATFRDGTYSGTGTSRHGNIGVAVKVQGGKIVSAEITECGTRYPCNLVAELPGQVIARQSAAVDVVTGATDSTNAYRAAVNAALAQAR